MSQPASASSKPGTLEQQREEYASRRFLAMPLAGTIAWTIIGLVGWLGTPYQAVMTLYFGAGAIFYLGVLLSRFTGENLLAKNKPKSDFDKLFISTVMMSLLVFAIALPWAAQDHRSVPLSIGILAGLMWLPFGWVIQHWIGAFHAIARTLSIVAAWYAFPGQRFVLIPAIIVAIYIVSIVVLERRWRRANGRSGFSRSAPPIIA
ncbi:DUF7010 family protein [Roseateles oligotrophus]|uniref:DUF308 domain-containing protein n=1 Tax=Roseateles oligotrophus TaxID=1769250 RepID=A0ABT2YL88_9BURK|nr:hypothetical protein [Roseateles oligotrophus]MCV2370767.1 hypothetical protein [Roseateles oligotrophus]